MKKEMILLAIDPGPEKCGVVGLQTGRIVLAEEADHERVRFLISGNWEKTVEQVLIEDVTPQMTMGMETLETKEYIGEVKAMCRAACIPFEKIARRDVKRALALGKATDAVVRADLLYRGWTKGTKKAPGPAYGVSKHCWQALALAVAWCEMQKAPRT